MFLKKQRNLQDLKLNEDFCNFLILPGIFEFKFSLNILEIYCKPRPFAYYESFIKFLHRHKKSLISLELIFFCTESQFGIDFIHKFALENLVNLKHLELGHFENKEEKYNTGDDLTYNELREATQLTRSLESLSVFGRSTDMN